MTVEQRRFWEENGYLILPAFLAEDAVASILQLHARVWSERPRDVIVDNLIEGGRSSIDEVPESAAQLPHKINDLYLNYREMRDCALDPSLVQILAELIGDAPALCNTLSLDFGTEQDSHVDSLYMTPPGESALIATWTALEDCHPDAGPLVYVPGSHKIPPYRFSDGRLSEIAAEHHAWDEYIRGEVAQRGLVEQEFLPRKGDVLIWHGQLLHGGGQRNDPKRTRRSLVCHYFTAQASRAAGYKLVPAQGGYWLQRPHQAATAAQRAAALSGRAVRQALYRLGLSSVLPIVLFN